MRPNQVEFAARIMKVGKRIAMTIVICIPVIILFAYLTRNVITSNVLQVVCFMFIMGTAVFVEELVARKKEKNRKEVEIEKRDVFR